MIETNLKICEKKIKEFAQTQGISLESIRRNKRKCRQQTKKSADFITNSTSGKGFLLNLPSDIYPTEYWRKISIFK